MCVCVCVCVSKQYSVFSACIFHIEATDVFKQESDSYNVCGSILEPQIMYNMIRIFVKLIETICSTDVENESVKANIYIRYYSKCV